MVSERFRAAVSSSFCLRFFTSSKAFIQSCGRESPTLVFLSSPTTPQGTNRCNDLDCATICQKSDIHQLMPLSCKISAMPKIAGLNGLIKLARCGGWHPSSTRRELEITLRGWVRPHRRTPHNKSNLKASRDLHALRVIPSGAAASCHRESSRRFMRVT